MSLAATSRALVITAAAAAACNSACAQAEPLRTAQDRSALSVLSGTYRSTATEAWYGAYGTREFSFINGRWSLKFVLALDPEMKAKVFEFRTQGPYYIGLASKAVPRAFDALFIEESKHVTLRARDAKIVQAFGLTGCDLQADVEKDVSAQGCAGWKPVSVCREDHDLLSLTEAGGLQFGERPRDNDMCTADKRPKALLQPVVKSL
jgi:hypothetical protein